MAAKLTMQDGRLEVVEATPEAICAAYECVIAEVRRCVSQHGSDAVNALKQSRKGCDKGKSEVGQGRQSQNAKSVWCGLFTLDEGDMWW